MTWRRLLFWIVYLAAWPVLFAMFISGFLAEAATSHIDRLDHWSKGKS